MGEGGNVSTSADILWALTLIFSTVHLQIIGGGGGRGNGFMTFMRAPWGYKSADWDSFWPKYL